MKYAPISDTITKYVPNLNPFIDYVFEDKSQYDLSARHGYKDLDNDFLIGTSGNILMNMDFVVVNTHEFCEVADTFVSNCESLVKPDTGFYISSKPGTQSYRDFWKRETGRRRAGMTILGKLRRDLIPAYNSAPNDDVRRSLLQPLRITGDHYNYLNYGRINRTPNPIEREELDRMGKLKVKTIKAFPRFWDGDYWNFKLDEFIANNNLNLCKGKARRKGYSFKRGSQAANTVNLYENVTVLLAAWDIKKLIDPGATADMVKTNLNWYENNTYWQRGFISEDMTELWLGYKESTAGHQVFGFNSKCLSVSLFNNSSAAAGKGALEIDYEEAGICPNLIESLGITQSVAESGDESVGTIRVYGTAGTKTANWRDFAFVFFNPKSFGMLALENVWDKGQRHKACGFFHPQILNYEPYQDEHGNSALVDAYYADFKRKDEAKKTKTTTDYLMFVGQRANSPQEAFRGGVENIFSSQELTNHAAFLRANYDQLAFREGIFYTDEKGKISFKTNDQLVSDGLSNLVHPYITDVPITKNTDVRGCWRIYHEPYIDPKTGRVPDDLYAQVIDPFGKDKSLKEIAITNSLSVIYVVSLPNDFGIPIGVIQAAYAGRDEETKGTSKHAMDAMWYYNAKACPETDRGTIVADFKAANLRNMLVKDPRAVLSDKIRDILAVEYGITVGTGENAVNAILDFKTWLYTVVATDEEGNKKMNLHYITDYPLIQELLDFNIEGNFDRISAGRIIPILIKSYLHRKIKATAPNTNARTLLGSIKLYN